LEFKSLQKSLSVSFVIYADFEALLQKLTENEKKKENDTSKESYTIKTHEHITCSYGYKVVCCENDKYSKPYK
jgi:hypothetical protein